jgi:hypothetical protein
MTDELAELNGDLYASKQKVNVSQIQKKEMSGSNWFRPAGSVKDDPALCNLYLKEVSCVERVARGVSASLGLFELYSINLRRIMFFRPQKSLGQNRGKRVAQRGGKGHRGFSHAG